MPRALAHSISLGDVDGLHGRAETSAAEQRGDDPHLAVEDLPVRLAAVGPPAPELAEREGVERARGDAVAQAERSEAVTQLAGGLAGEGDGDDVVGLGANPARRDRRFGG